jgi:apolipoprotein D and lipocalin family protein
MRTYDIVTRCRRADGSEETDVGIARVQDLNTNAKMEWRFLPLALAWWPFAWTDYWIVDLAPDYSYAMAAMPSREALWILARRTELDAAVYDRLVAKARALGFDTGKLVRTRHSGS